MGLGVWASVAALIPSPTAKIALLAAPLLFVFLWWSCGHRDRWIRAFFVCALLLPPLPIALGDSGPHVAPLLVLLGIIYGVALQQKRDPIDVTLLRSAAVLVFSLGLSAAIAALSTTAEIALLSEFRTALFAIGPLVLMHALQSTDPKRITSMSRLLFRVATLGGLFACVDFYFQFPSPAGFGPQFVWLENAVLRRAQGLFYEASTLGNVCAFFLVFAFVMFFAEPEHRPCSRLELGLGSLVLGAALVLSYSRASLLNLLCAGNAFLILRKGARAKAFWLAATVPVVLATCLAIALPELWHSYWIRIETSVLYFSSAPEAVLSGRVSSWTLLSHFALEHPEHLLLGIGYKTLPYSSVVGERVIADNTYLSLLIETGLLGLGSFLALSFEMLRRSLRVAQNGLGIQALLAIIFFCFWIGEMVQMASGDLITYWRVLPVYFWVLGAALAGERRGGNARQR